ncbi:class D beta-lactamase [Flavobacterium sp. YO12]|uniref:class D beta-lactamase n=1 Tax=Flavobacterium sp. YO12 TaxID=1920029 RepID=UPI00100B8F2D|nr:class D beta-lactamase [Flavobacterium sp. YO12]RXM49154.1 penicillin binding protein transpeptidase domain-containing protein [Flavobacterium sp. YO12]
MNLKQLFTGFLILGFLFSCSSNLKKGDHTIISNHDKIVIRSDFKKYFDNCNVEGSIAIYDNNKHRWFLSDTIGTKKETLPASTFKIINLLIALETKTISSENDIVKWPRTTDTIKYGYRPEIYHDITVKEAFEVSAGWAFVELAKKIGKDNYKKYLSLCHYGNLDLSQTDADFWNFGNFKISPLNQVVFLKNLYDEKLPFSKRNMQIVKKVMLTEQNSDYSIYSKTGWTRENEINTGWWVGYIVNNNGTYFFATRLLQDRKINSAAFGNCRKDITKSVFKDLSIVK